MTSALTNQQRVFKACLTQTERVSDDVTRKIGPLDFNLMICSNLTLSTAGSLLYVVNDTDDSVGTRGSPIDDRVDGYRHTVPR